MKIRPLSDRVVVKVVKKEEKTKSGIIIPDSSKSSGPLFGEVLAVGPGRIQDGEVRAVQVKVGETVMFEDWAGKEYEDGDITFRVISEHELLGVAEK